MCVCVYVRLCVCVASLYSPSFTLHAQALYRLKSESIGGEHRGHAQCIPLNQLTSVEWSAAVKRVGYYSLALIFSFVYFLFSFLRDIVGHGKALGALKIQVTGDSYKYDLSCLPLSHM